MNEFELTYIVEPISEDVLERLMDEEDCLTGMNHSGQSYIIITAVGGNAVTAGKNMHLNLIGRGIDVTHVEYDLVSRSEIARRLDKTPQAVGNWIRRDRPTREEFPSMFSEVGGGIWLWSDVVDWARRAIKVDADPGLRFPGRADIEEINVCIRKNYSIDTKPSHSYSLRTEPSTPRMVITDLFHTDLNAQRNFRLDSLLHIVAEDVDA